MELFLLFVAVIAVYRWQRGRRQNDENVRVVGEATEYAPCPVCGKANTQYPRGRGEIITRGGSWVVRQYHICSNCNTRALWHRRRDLWVWTVFRDGVSRP